MDEPRQGFFRRYREALLTILGVLFTAGVAGVSGYSSWDHIVHVGESVQEPNAGLLPVAIDGMMLASTVMAAVDHLRGYRTRWWAVIGLWLGSTLTLAFNVASAYTRGLFAMMIAVLYAVSLLVTVEMMFHPSRTPLDAVRKWRGKVNNIAALEQKTTEVVPPSTPIPAPVAVQPEPEPKSVNVEPVVIAAPKLQPPTPGRPGRKPGPQEPPNKRRAGKQRFGGAAVGPTKLAEMSDEDRVKAIVIMRPDEENPPATGDSQKAVVAEESPASS